MATTPKVTPHLIEILAGINADGGRDPGIGTRPPLARAQSTFSLGATSELNRCRELGQFVRGKIFESPSGSVEAILKPQSDHMKFRRVDSPGDVGKLGRAYFGEPEIETFQLGFEPEHGLKHLGVRLGRPSHEEAFLPGAEALVAVHAVEAEPDDRGLELAWSARGLRRHGHLEEGLSQNGMPIQRARRAARGGFPLRAFSPRDFLSASNPRSNRDESVNRSTPIAYPPQSSYDPLRHSLAVSRATL